MPVLASEGWLQQGKLDINSYGVCSHPLALQHALFNTCCHTLARMQIGNRNGEALALVLEQGKPEGSPELCSFCIGDNGLSKATVQKVLEALAGV